MNADKKTIKISKTISEQLLKSYQPESKILDLIVKVIKDNDSFILTTHMNADADGLGSQVGLYHLLKKLIKTCIIINNEPPPSNLEFMIPNNIVKTVDDFKHDALLNKFKKTTVLILDSSELKRSGSVSDYITESKCNWYTLDHHVKPVQKNYFSDPSYGATAELIWDLHQKMKIQVHKNAALALYTGIVADTGNFRYPKTSLRTMLAGGDLLQHGIDGDYIYRILYENQPSDRLLYLKRIYSDLIINKKYKFALGQVPKRRKVGLELGDSANDGIVNMLMGVEGILMSGLMSETEEGELKSSLRSEGNIDVASIAREFGGGGHKNAAGLKINKPFKQAKVLLENAIKKKMKEYL